MDVQLFTLWFMLPLVLVVEAVLLAYTWRGEPGRVPLGGVERVLHSLARNPTGIAVIVVLWMLMTAVVWVYEFAVAFLALHLLLFSLGRIAAFVGLVAFAAIFLATPVICGRLVLHFSHRKSAAPTTPSGLPAVRV